MINDNPPTTIEDKGKIFWKHVNDKSGFYDTNHIIGSDHDGRIVNSDVRSLNLNNFLGLGHER